MSDNYNNTFGGENVSPSNLSYVEYTISGNIALTWAFEAVSDDFVTADKIAINCTVANQSVAMPPANQVTVGQDVLFDGIGAEPYIVTDHVGNTICTVTSGTQWFVYLVNNTTIPGLWRAVQFGSTISVANAGALAGAGLRAHGTQLEQNLPTTPLTASYVVTEADRATVLQSNGGAVTYSLPDPAVVGDGFFVYVVNFGTGNILLLPGGGHLIDEAVDKSIAPGESLIVLSDGGAYQSVGYGRSSSGSVTGTAVNAAGTGTLVLSSTQQKAQIQDFTGTLTGDRRIEYGGAVGYWFVWNKTDPVTPFLMRFATNALDTGVVVPQGILPAGTFSILRSNGTDMEIAFSDAGGSVTSVATSTDLIGGPITTSGTLGLSNTGVTAGTYGNIGPPALVPTILVSDKGRITTAGTFPLGTAASYNIGAGPGSIAILDAGGNIPSQNGGMQPGDVVYSIALSKPGFVFANGSTIGSAASGGSQRANADTVNLFSVIWSLPSAIFLIYSSTGVLTTRGANATVDFNANKRIALPDLRGMVIAGLDNAGGAPSAGRISNTVSSTVMGGTGGFQQIALTEDQLATHSHSNSVVVTPSPHNHSLPNGRLINGGTGDNDFIAYDPGASAPPGTTSSENATVGVVVTINGTGSGNLHGNTQPTTVMNPFIKL